MRRIGMHSELYKEYKNELPLNTIKVWNKVLLENLDWQHTGWSGDMKEPFRHWASYPSFEGDVKKIWEAISPSLVEDGWNLKVDRVIANLFNHGDSSWLHKDCDKETSWTVIVYLNDFWDPNWHGGTAIVENNDVSAYFHPTPGKFIIFRSNLLHGATPVSREAAFPRFGLTFQTHDHNVQRLSQIEVSSVPAKL